MKRIQIAFLLSSLFFTSWASANSNRQSFTPSHVWIPIRSVYLVNTETHDAGTLYECAANSEADCLVDIANSSALADLLKNPSQIKVGTYSKISVSTCKTEGEYNAIIEGSVDINGTTYYTHSTQALTSDSTQASAVQLHYSGCQRDYILPQPVTVKSDSLVEISLFIPLGQIAWGGTTQAPIPSGCRENSNRTLSVCMGYPDVSPYVGSTTPSVEIYGISEPPLTTDTAAGQVILLFDSNGGFIGGTTRRLYLANSQDGHGGYDTPIRIATQNNDGSFHLENYGSTGSTSYLVFPSFQRGNHTGQFTSYNWGGNSYTYEATRLNP